VTDLHNVAYPRHTLHFVGLEALHLAAEHRRVLDRGVEHAGQLQIRAVDLGAGDLSHRIEALHRLADELPVHGVLQRDLGRRRWRELRSSFRDLAVGRRAAGGFVSDHAVGGRALGRGNAPPVGRGLDQHDPGSRAALADVLVRLADTAAATRREVPPHALARDALAGRRIFGRDFRPVALELFGHHLGKTGERALAHLGPRDPNHHRVVWANDHPGIDLGRAVLSTDDAGAERNLQAERQAGADCGSADDERAAIDLRSLDDHGRSPYAFAAAWMASRTCWNVPQRQMFVIEASMSASVGLGLSLRSAATAMIIPAWQ